MIRVKSDLRGVAVNLRHCAGMFSYVMERCSVQDDLNTLGGLDFDHVMASTK